MRRSPKEEDEEDEGALKEDESRPRRTLGTKECPKAPQNMSKAVQCFAVAGGVFWGRAVRHVTVSVSRRGAQRAGGPPSEADRDSHIAGARPQKLRL